MVIMIPASNLSLRNYVVGLFDRDAGDWSVARWRNEHDSYEPSLEKFGLKSTITINGKVNTLQIEATKHQFMALITDEADHVTYTINQEGLVQQLNTRHN